MTAGRRFVELLVQLLLVEDGADVEAAHHQLGVGVLERGAEPLPRLGERLRRRDPEGGVALLQAELLVPGGDLVRFVLPEEHAERGVDAGADDGARVTVRAGPRVDVGEALGLGQQPRGFHDRVVAPDQHAERAGLGGAGIGRQGVVHAGDLEGGDLVVAVVEELVVDLGRSGQ